MPGGELEYLISWPWLSRCDRGGGERAPCWGGEGARCWGGESRKRSYEGKKEGQESHLRCSGRKHSSFQMRRPRVQLSENSSNQLSENSLLLSGYPGYGKAKLGMVLDPSQIDRARLRLLKRNLLKNAKNENHGSKFIWFTFRELLGLNRPQKKTCFFSVAWMCSVRPALVYVLQER